MIDKIPSDTNFEGNVESQPRLRPSEFMRRLRPEYYSDTTDSATYLLERPTLEYQLDSITSRNQTHAFELFCRKLCERVICPNLRPQTGPEGGGDSKADSETYPVSDEVAAIFIGDPNAGRERWAFAFSAKAKWQQKVRDDVAGIVGTGRHYDRIICITSRFARAKDRAALEDALSSQYGIPVTVHDRSWIVKEIIEENRKDLAFNYLGVGSIKNDPLALGPADYSRTRQLAEIERTLENSSTYKGMENQRVSEALVAAKLSRNLERPRTETDGRFLRAIRYARENGTEHQRLECRYEHAWTAFWWFDDIDFVLEIYDAFEADALKSDHAADLELACNLYQLLVNSVIHNHLSREEAKLDQRRTRLRNALEAVVGNVQRPNNSLEAESLLVMLRLNAAMIDGDQSLLPSIWDDFRQIVAKADGLAEFDATRLERMIEVAGVVAENDSSYTELIEKLADFVSKRRSEGEGAIVLLRRAQKLDFEHRLDMIRLLGKAAIRLAKKEYRAHLIEALQLLALAYRSADLLWAARSSCLFALATIVIDGEEDSCIPVSIIPTLKAWAWISFSLGHLPDYCSAVQLLNGALLTLPLTDESEELVREDLQHLDLALGSLMLNLDAFELDRLADVPESLRGLGLFFARSALLYINGHLPTMKEDGTIPASEPDEGVHEFMSRLASQPVGSQINHTIILNDLGPQTYGTTVMGMRVMLTHDGTDQAIMLTEVVLGALEAFFGTALEHRVTAHAEAININLHVAGNAAKPLVTVEKLDMRVDLTWPLSFVIPNVIQQSELHAFLIDAVGHIFELGFMASDIKQVLEELFKNDAVQQRIGMILTTANSYHRLCGRNLSRLDKWRAAGHRSYPPVPPRPVLSKLETSPKSGRREDSQERRGPYFPPHVTAHRSIQVQSVVDVHAWNQAKWKGIGYEGYGPKFPPVMTFLFEEQVAAAKIFERWQERVGSKDENDDIYISIIRNLPNESPHHYIVMVCGKPPSAGAGKTPVIYNMATRSMMMTPTSSANIERFLEEYKRCRCFVIAPSIVNGTGMPDTMRKLSILKRNIVVKEAAEVDEHDIEIVALRIRTP